MHGTLLGAGALLACAGAAALLVYRWDMYDREPWWALVATFGLGVALMAALGRLEDVTLALLNHATGDVTLALVAALEEELGKLMLVVGVALVAQRQFNDPLDGLVYGSLAGIGMAVEESLNGPGASSRVTSLELVRVFGHMVMGGLAGFGVGLARRRIHGWPEALAGSLAAAVTLHFLWDWIALWRPPAGLHLWQALGAAGLMCGGVLVYGVLVERGSILSKAAFAPGSRRSLWGWPFRPPSG